MMAHIDNASILVVDDQDGIRQFQRQALEQAGYQVTEASSGLEALALLEQGRLFDLVIADIAMPGLTGVEMAGTHPDGLSRPENPLCHRPARSTDGCPLAVGGRSVSREAVLAGGIARGGLAPAVRHVEEAVGRAVAGAGPERGARTAVAPSAVGAPPVRSRSAIPPGGSVMRRLSIRWPMSPCRAGV